MAPGGRAAHRGAGLQPEAYEPKELASFRLQVRGAAKDVRENARALAIPPNVRARLQTEQPTEAQRFGFVFIPGGRAA